MAESIPGTAHGHRAQLFTSDAFLATAVARYLGAALGTGESALVVATEPHWRLVRERLLDRGFDVPGAQAAGRLRVLDADETLARLLHGGAPSLRAFDAVITPVLEEARSAAPAPRVRAFGEMVDLLWERGQFEVAEALEAVWNRAMGERQFALLCGYRADPFDPTMPVRAVQATFAAHDRVAVQDRATVADRFDQAVDEVLGPSQAAMLRVVVAASHPPQDYAKAPVEYRMLWLRSHMPRIAERVHAAMRDGGHRLHG